jgi:TolA-binding protein
MFFRPGPIHIVTVLLMAAQPFSAPATAAADEVNDEAALRSYLSANGLLNRGLYDLAEQEYRRFLQEHGSHEKAPVARYGLCVCLYRTEQFAAAITELSQLVSQKNFAFAAEVRAMLGQCHLALKQYDQAAEALTDLLRTHGEHELADDAAALLVEAYYLGNKHEPALEHCRNFESRWPNSPLRERVLFFAGLAHMARGDHQAATERLAELLKAFPHTGFAEQAALLLARCYHQQGALDRATRWYRKVLENPAGNYTPDALHGLATLLHQQGDPASAGKLLDTLLERFPEHELRTQASLLRGRTWFEQEEYQRAADLFAQIEQAGGALADDGAYWLAKCRLRQGDFPDAARRLEQTLQRFPESELLPELRYDLGVALARAGQEDAASQALRAFLSKHAEHALVPDALALLATIEHRQCEYERSQTHCREFLARHADHTLAPSMKFLSAENSFLTQQYKDALRVYTEFLDQHGTDAQAGKARYRLGMTLFHLERYDQALPPLLATAVATSGDHTFDACELALGEIYFQRGEWAQAEEHLAKYLDTGPDVPSADAALLKLGLARQRQGKQSEARQAFERLLDEFPDSPVRLHALFERGQALVALNEPDEAVKTFERVLEEGPDSRFAPFALNHLGAIAAGRDQHEQAADLFGRLLTKDVDDELAAEARFQRGEALLAAQQFDSAHKAFADFLRKHPESPRAPCARARLAVTLARLDRPKQALEAIEQVARDDLNRLDPPTRLALQHEKAWCLKQLNRLDDAAATYRALIDDVTNPRLQAYALLELAEIEAGKQNHAEAVSLLRRLHKIAASPDAEIADDVWAQSLYRLGVCLFELNHPSEAAEVLDAFLSEFPSHTLVASASFFCGEALLKAGENQRAAAHFSRVVENFEEDDTYGPSLLRLGECLAVLQRWAASEAVFAKYLQHQADSEHWYQARFGLGWTRENQQRYDEAIAAYREVVQRHKGITAARAQFQIGECLFAQKKLDEAVRELLKVDILYAYPEWSAAALYEAGRCFEQMGKPVEARGQYQRVSAEHSGTRWAELATQRLAAVTSGNLPGRNPENQ